MGWLLTAWKAYRLWIGIGVVVALVGGLVLYVHGAEQAKVKVVVLKDRIARMETVARQNQTAFEQCDAANRANAVAAAKQLERARQAEIKFAALKAAADARVESLPREAETLRGRGLECPALDSDFRRWIRQ